MWWNKGCWWRAECASRDGFLIGSWGTGALCRFCWWPIQKSGQDWWQQGLWCGGVWWSQQWRNLPHVWISRKSQVCDFSWFPKHSCSVYPLWKCPKALMHCFSWSNPSIFNKCTEHKILRCLSISVPCLCTDMHSCNTFRLRSITLSNNTNDDAWQQCNHTYPKLFNDSLSFIIWMHRWYLSRFRSIAEKTDAGRVTLPSVLKLIEGAFLDEGKGTPRSTNEIWEAGDRVLSVSVFCSRLVTSRVLSIVMDEVSFSLRFALF